MDKSHRITCDCCGEKTAFLTNSVLVFGKENKGWPLIWFCKKCMATVACHPNTTIPMGRLANKKTRILRKRAHDIFDKLWQCQMMSRDESYQLLSKWLNIPREQCHFALLSDVHLRKVIDAEPEIEAITKPYRVAIVDSRTKRKLRRIEDKERYEKITRFKRKRRK